MRHLVTILVNAVSLTIITAVSTLLPAQPAGAQERKCECKFADPNWEAFGTKAGCSAYVRKARTSCEIEFGGISAEDQLVEDVLGINPQLYRKELYSLLSDYLVYLRDNKREQLARPEFLQRSLLIFMRGAYLRGSPDIREREQIKVLDATVRAILEKLAPQIAEVFLGRIGGFSTEINDAKVSIGRGFILIELPDRQLFTRYFAAE
jgi:hypothetical protein